MYRFLLKPRWIGFHLLVVAAIVAMINLGFWQLRRLDERQSFNATVEARFDLPPVPLDDLVPPDATTDDPELGTVEWRAVSVAGDYLPDEQLLIVNRSQNGRAGDNVITPVELDDGRILLVNRGFVPLGIDTPPAPSGPAELIGRIHPTQERRLGQLSDPADGDLEVAQRVDIERLAPQLPSPVVPVYVDVITDSVAGGDPRFPEPVVAPDLSEGNHLAYAVQWFIFATAVAAGWVLAVRKSISTNRRATAESTEQLLDSPTSTDDQTKQISPVADEQLSPHAPRHPPGDASHHVGDGGRADVDA